MYRDTDSLGSYPEADAWPEFEAVQSDASDTPELLIARGDSRYTTSMAHALERQTGDRDTYLTAEQEYEIAQTLERGREASDRLQAGSWHDDAERTLLEKDIATAKVAREKLILANLRLAAFYARASMNILTPEDRKNKRFIGTYADITTLASPAASLDDRIQYANEGLIQAADTFKPHLSEKTGKPTRFTTYASWPIQQYISRRVRETEHTGIRLPEHIYVEIAKIKRSRSVSPEEAAKYGLYLARSRSRVSYESLTSNRHDTDRDNDAWDERGTLPLAETMFDENQLSVEDVVENRIRKETTDKLLGHLSEREERVIRMRYAYDDDDEMTLDGIGDRFGASKERIRQIQNKTISKLQHPSRSTQLQDFYRNDPPILQATRSLASIDQAPLEGDDVWRLDTKTDQSSRVTLEPWQVEPGEAWDAPVRHAVEAVPDSELAFTVAKEVLEDMFTESFAATAESAAIPSYPVELIELLREALGRPLRPDHIEGLWHDHLLPLIDAAGSGSIDMTRVSLFMTTLLRDSMTPEDDVTLTVPAGLGTRMNYFGWGLRSGRVYIDGDLGDYAGSGMAGISTLEVSGSVGDDAGTRMEGLSTLIIHGDAGYRLGTDSDSVTVVCEGERKQYAPVVEAETVAPVAVRREMARSAVTVASLRARIAAQESILAALDALGDDASMYQVSQTTKRIDDLKRDIKAAQARDYWSNLRQGMAK